MEKNGRPPVDEKIKELLRVPSIGGLSARALLDEGFESISQLKEAGLEKIRTVEHIGDERASDIYMEIQEEKVREEQSRTDEFECPDCSNFVRIEDENCSECGRALEIEGGAVLPEKGVIENPKEALAEVEEKIWDDEGNPESWFVRGSILENINANKKALEAYDKVIELDPLYEHIWNAKASLSLKLGRTQEAARAYKVAFDAHGAPAGMIEDMPETPSAEEREKFEFEEDEEVKNAEEKISEARFAVERLASEDIDLTGLRSLLDEATEARVNDELDLAVEKATDVIKKSEDAQSFVETMKAADERLAQLEEKDEERYQKYRETLDELKESKKEAGFEKLVEKTKSLIDDIDEAMKVGGERKERLSEMIEKGKNILKEKRDSALRIGPLKNDLKEAIKKQKMEKFEEGLEKVEAMQKRAEIVSEIDDLVDDFKEKVKDIEKEQEDVAEKVKADMKDIIESSGEGDYKKVRNWVNDLLYSMEQGLERSKKEKSPEKILREKIAGLKDLKDGLSEEAADMLGIAKIISKADEDLQQRRYESGMKRTRYLLTDDDLLKDISDVFEKVNTKKTELEESGCSESVIKEIEGRIEEAKEECRDGEHEDAMTSFRSVLEDLEELIEGEKEKVTEEISEAVEDVEEVLEKAKEKGIELTGLEEEFKEIEEGEGDEEERLSRLKDLRERGKSSLKFRLLVSEIEKKIEEEGDGELEEYKDQLEELREEFESGDREDAIKKGEELKEDVDMIVEMKGAGVEEEVGGEEVEEVVYECPNCGAEIGEDDRSCDNCGVVFEELEEGSAEQEEDIEHLAEEALEEAKENLADLRGSELGLGKLKRSVKKANQAKKEEDHQTAKSFAEEAVEASSDLEEIIDLCDEAEKKLDKLAEKGLIKDGKSYEKEVNRYKRATNIGLYASVKKNLEDLVRELEEGLEEEKDVPLEGDRNLASEIKGKIKDLKELHDDVEKSGIDIQINKQYLKEAIPKIKAKAYEEAFKTLSKGEKDLLDKLDSELRDKIESLRERIESSDIEVGVAKVQMFIDEIERLWRSDEHRAALELLLKTSELVRSLEECGSKIERRLLTVSQIIEDMESSGFDIEKEKGSLDEAEDMEKGDEMKEKIEDIKTSLATKLSDRIKEEVEEAEERVKDLRREKVSIMLDHLTRAESGRRKDDVGKMSWYWKKYWEVLEE